MRTAIRHSAFGTLNPRTIAVLVAMVVGAAGCVPQPRSAETPSPEPAATVPAPPGWVEHEIPGSGVTIDLPEGWRVVTEDDLTDPDRRAELARDFEGAEALFGQLEAQGRRARIVLLAVDERARGTGSFAPNVTVVAVEPVLPPLLLGLGADFAIAALESTFAVETEVARTNVGTPLGDGIRIAFSHRVVGPAGGRGTLAEYDGVLVTTGSASLLVSRNIDPETAPPDTPTLDEVVATLRVPDAPG
jgi:hypothetical protein